MELIHMVQMCMLPITIEHKMLRLNSLNKVVIPMMLLLLKVFSLQLQPLQQPLLEKA
jgi:hypothetical protein